ncbi:DNA breaking-rejoining enzyme, partial [Mycena pura]
CDSRSSDGTLKDPTVQRATFAYAQKIRAAISFRFARIKSTAGITWHFSEVAAKMVGNPATAIIVSQYFVSLKRRKVQAGEASTSARAMTPDILYAMYMYNISEDRMVRRNYGAGEPKKWDGPLCRRMTWFAYLLMYTCLLRVDKVIKIQAHNIVFNLQENSITVTLPFRKTHQFGDIKPYVIYLLPPHEAHLCVVRAYAYFLRESKIQRGYLFRNILAGDTIDINKSEPMVTAHFLEIFRNHLICINIDHTPYGTHSFRRGGCQYFANYRRWPLRKICEWGGWSQEFTHATIVKYLISWNDNPLDAREDFLRPGLPVGVHCHSCGRTCPCA